MSSMAKKATGFMDAKPIQLPCPLCGAAVPTTVGETRRSPTLRCANGHSVTYQAEQFNDGIQQMEKRVEDMMRRFGN